MKAAPDVSHFFLTRDKFLGHIIEGNKITALKSRIDTIIKLHPPSNKTKIQEFFGMLNLLGKFVFKMRLYLKHIHNLEKFQKLDPVIRLLKSWHKYRTKPVNTDTRMLQKI